MASDLPRIASLADHPHLIAQVGELRWREWGYGDPDPNAWISVTAQEAGQDQLPITLVAIGASGDAIGAVALGQADNELNDTERRGRSPWLLGLVVKSDARRQGVGRLLVAELERMAADRGYPQV
jgi:GNAT superfamily N-acetyltransferase